MKLAAIHAAKIIDRRGIGRSDVIAASEFDIEFMNGSAGDRCP
jgi:hypothetical protein